MASKTENNDDNKKDNEIVKSCIAEDEVLKVIREKVNALKLLDYSKLSSEIKEMKIELPADFSDIGVGVINELISKCQAYRTRITFIGLEALKDLAYRKRYYELALQHILTVDDEIASKKSNELRIAAANVIIRDLEESKFKAELFVDMLERVAENLKVINDNISRQLTALQLQSSLGEISRKSFKDE